MVALHTHCFTPSQCILGRQSNSTYSSSRSDTPKRKLNSLSLKDATKYLLEIKHAIPGSACMQNTPTIKLKRATWCNAHGKCILTPMVCSNQMSWIGRDLQRMT